MSGRRPPERWAADSGLRDVVRLDIPADAARERSFEINCRLVVRNSARRHDMPHATPSTSATSATHAMRVLVDGALEWSRSAATHADVDGSGEDSLELRLRRTVPIGRPLRLSASCELRFAVRVSLSIVAEEE